MAQGQMARDLKRIRDAYNDMHEFHKKQNAIVSGICPFQRNDKVRLVRYLKYFKHDFIGVGTVGKVCRVDWNKEYGYIISVSFPEIPKRYFWMPVYLFRSADWVEKDNTWTIKVKNYLLTIEKQDEVFLCKFVNRKVLESEFIIKDLIQGMDTLECLWYFNKVFIRGREQ